MGTLKKYRFRLAWQNFRVGNEIEPTGVTRDWLLANGYIEPVADQPPAQDPDPPVVSEPVPRLVPELPATGPVPDLTPRKRQRA